MAEERPNGFRQTGGDSAGRLPRRGLVAGIVAFAAAMLAKLAGPGRAEAGHRGGNIFHLEEDNETDDTTQLSASGGRDNGALKVTNTRGRGIVVEPSPDFDGITVQTRGEARGVAASAEFVAILGSGSGDRAIGVEGFSLHGLGVLGVSAETFGVLGQSRDDYGVFGDGRDGVGGRGRGRTQADSGTGVRGDADGHGWGVIGSAPDGTGVRGDTLRGVAVQGNVNLIGGDGLAGEFFGPVEVQGTLTVNGVVVAAVPHPDGSHRGVYAVKSPESWFEDFGRGRLANGRGEVRLDPDFAAVVRTDEYHVFLMPEGDSKGLYVSHRSPTGFEVREQQGGASSLAFSYRVVAKRGNIEGPRLERVKLRPRPAPPPALPSDPPRRHIPESARTGAT